MKRLLISSLLSMLAVLLLSSGVLATSIDFDSSFNVIDGEQEYTFTDFLPGIDLTIESRRTDQYLTWDASDNGIGIVDDEISGGYTSWETDRETLRFTFSEKVYLSSLFIVDIFPNEGTDGEFGYLKLDYGNGFEDLTMFGPGNSQGNLTVDINKEVFGINMWAVNNSIYDYAVAGMDVAPVPEPSTFLLLGSGLLGLGLYGRKRKKA